MSDYSNSYKQSSIVAIILFILFTIGVFIAGRMTVVGKVEVVYLQGDTITGTVADLHPVKETVPDDPILPLKRDTFWRDRIVYVSEVVDTAAIILDYITSREYMPILFDTPQLGKLSLSASIQYNRLQDLSYTFVPVYKEITKYRVPVWQTFVGGSINSFGHATLSGGTYYNKVGVELQVVTDFRRKGYGFGLKWIF